MNWNTKRRLVYGMAVIFFVTSLTLYVFREVLFPAPSCFDMKKNGSEIDVDCGGTCSLRCSQEVIPISVNWSRALKTSPTVYDFVAMVSNKNIDNAPRVLPYTFIAYDISGKELKTITGTTSAPVDGDFPIVVQNIVLTQEPKEVIASVTNGPHFNVKESPTSPTLRITGTRYEAGSIPRVYATITNTKRLTISNLPVRVVLSDVEGNVMGVGETIIPFLDKEETKEISFTWDVPFANAPTLIHVYPIFDPFLSNK